MKKYIILNIILFLLPFSGRSQYFGRNKVMYDQFDFKVYKTTHFDIHTYLDDDSVLYQFGQQAEKWNKRHFAIFPDTLKNHPIILYNNHPDFKQTNAISGSIGVGTGGVTESGRTRVIMPFMVANNATDHVLGHEMVHAFQYTLVKRSDSLSIQHLMYMPLWMIEGLAEYLSIGPTDNKTAMWMRDAVISNDIPTIDDMTTKMYKYNPYRYGHAMWSYIAGVWGDNIIRTLFDQSLKQGYEQAFENILGFTTDSLSVIWANSLKEYYAPYLKDSLEIIGDTLFNPDNSGLYNLSPVISPDGKYMTYISDKDVIGVDILMVDLETKKVIKKLTKSIQKSHIDDFNFIEDVGSWSPDGNKYVLTSVSKGRMNLIITEVSKKQVKTIRDFPIEGLEAFMYPQWSPDGNYILLTGLKNGRSDLYLYDLKNDVLKQITNDQYSDLHPKWSSDGSHIIFISDRGSDTNLDKQIYGSYKLCKLNITDFSIEVIDLLPGADIFSPQYGPEDTSIYFLSNADGFRNLYRWDMQSNQIFKLTKFATGVSGITDLAPAYSISIPNREIVYTLYQKGNYNIYKAGFDEFHQIPFTKDSVNRIAETLPPESENRIFNLVGEQIKVYPEQDTSTFAYNKYKPKFTLEYIGASGIGFGSSNWGTYGSGAIAALFTDMLKENTIYTVLAINGEIYDIGGQLAYINQKHRVNWGVGYSHIPYRYSFWTLGNELDTIKNNGYYSIVGVLNDMRIRIFEDQVSFFNHIPISSKIRFESSASMSYYSYRIDSVVHYFTPIMTSDTSYLIGPKVGEKKIKINAPDPYYVGMVNLAFVGDNSSYGFTSPLSGYRFRIEANRMFMDYDAWGATVDLRKYFYFKPFSFALRGLHLGRYGKDKYNLYPYFLGNNYFIRGYTYDSFEKAQYREDENLNINSLIGTKILVANAELRYPFTGYERLALIKSNYFYTDLVLFFDGGLAWNKESPFAKNSEINFTWNPDYYHYVPVFSTGLSLRINLFGYMVLEPYVAMPFQHEGLTTVFGLGISGGGW